MLHHVHCAFAHDVDGRLDRLVADRFITIEYDRLRLRPNHRGLILGGSGAVLTVVPRYGDQQQRG
ncbi:MAG: hypothetical protein A3205_05110 [Methanomassiliicoccales archaeon Mx-03]|nr:MAG: hypothetical protein A3205_05110 [Methanomassiliicoccales archaeon Mx-03]